MLYPQSGDRIVAVDFVTSLHAVYSVPVPVSHKLRCLYLEHPQLRSPMKTICEM